ncbi:MAG: class I SAM-dependent rRNA methyltransferase [Myxococcales bacterium]|nr:class I SAM-dependent rRNA methyltransferase [Myxococcales bacterium]
MAAAPLSVTPRARLTKPLRSQIELGHPWVFNRAIALPAGVASGQVVQLIDEKGVVASAYVDRDCPIAARVLAVGDAPITMAGMSDRLARCIARRDVAPDLSQTNSRRLVHGEADGCPGLVIDQYDCALAIVFDGEGAEAFWRPYLPALDALLAPRGVRGAWLRRVGAKARTPHGTPPAMVPLYEGSARFEVDLVHGQKTGFFLDQRTNRFDIGGIAAGLSVLNLFAYTGGFSIHAALGGASSVDSVDIAAPATRATLANAELSGVRTSVRAHAADAFAYLKQARAQGRTWDLVIVDPPSFAPSERGLAAGLAAYRELNALAMRSVTPGGIFASASCSSHVRRDAFLDMLGAAAHDAGITWRLTRQGGAGSDHPVSPGFIEGDYLKFARGICHPQ